MDIPVLISHARIARRLTAMAAKISHDYAEKTPAVVGVLRGACMVMGSLLPRLAIPLTVDFIATSSYADTASTGVVRLEKDLSDSVRNRHVLLVEDIVDTGLTLRYLRNLLAQRGAASVRICALLDKPANRKVEVQVDYRGFVLKGNDFVVGFGLDYKGLYRNLDYIGVLPAS